MDKPIPSEVPASHWDEPAECLPCEGTGKVTKWRRGLQEAQSELAFEALVENIVFHSKFWEMTDSQIADLLEEHVSSRFGDITREGELVSQAIDRLRRANGGVLPIVPIDPQE